MNWEVTEKDRAYLRELAKKQAEYAALPIMEERKKMWYDVNDGKTGARPPFVIACGFSGEFIPKEVLNCEGELARNIEFRLLKHIRNHEFINDDKVIPDTYDIEWFTDIDDLGVKIDFERGKDMDGKDAGYHYLHPITDLKRDLQLLKPARCSVDREKTYAWKAFLEEIFDGFLKVEIRSDSLGHPFLTHYVVRLMGMEAFCLAMYDTPDEMHKLMGILRDNALAVRKWAEKEKLLRLNNGNQFTGYDSPGFTHLLPADDFDGENVRLKDTWWRSNSQETISVSPEMFHEFCFPYYRDICEPFGLIYWGCCEPVHNHWEDIKRLPHLKKVSISRWCDEKFMGEALQGTDIVFSRKPDPNFLSVDKTLNESGWAAHIRETLAAAKGALVEFVMRDVTTVHSDLNKVKRAVEIARVVSQEYAV